MHTINTQLSLLFLALLSAFPQSSVAAYSPSSTSHFSYLLQMEITPQLGQAFKAARVSSNLRTGASIKAQRSSLLACLPVVRTSLLCMLLALNIAIVILKQMPHTTYDDQQGKPGSPAQPVGVTQGVTTPAMPALAVGPLLLDVLAAAPEPKGTEPVSTMLAAGLEAPSVPHQAGIEHAAIPASVADAGPVAIEAELTAEAEVTHSLTQLATAVQSLQQQTTSIQASLQQSATGLPGLTDRVAATDQVITQLTATIESPTQQITVTSSRGTELAVATPVTPPQPAVPQAASELASNAPTLQQHVGVASPTGISAEELSEYLAAPERASAVTAPAPQPPAEVLLEHLVAQQLQALTQLAATDPAANLELRMLHHLAATEPAASLPPITLPAARVLAESLFFQLINAHVHGLTEQALTNPSARTELQALNQLAAGTQLVPLHPAITELAVMNLVASIRDGVHLAVANVGLTAASARVRAMHSQRAHDQAMHSQRAHDQATITVTSNGSPARSSASVNDADPQAEYGTTEWHTFQTLSDTSEQLAALKAHSNYGTLCLWYGLSCFFYCVCKII